MVSKMIGITVKHAENEHAYNEFSPIVKRYLFPYEDLTGYKEMALEVYLNSVLLYNEVQL